MKKNNKNKNAECGLSMVKYSSAKNIILSFFKSDYPKLTKNEILEQYTTFSFNENKSKRKISKLIQEIHDNGFWGFCSVYENGDRGIHYWIDKNRDVSIENMMDLFAHELAHAVGYKSEKHACSIGTIASYTYDIVRKIEKNRKKTFTTDPNI